MIIKNGHYTINREIFVRFDGNCSFEINGYLKIREWQ